MITEQEWLNLYDNFQYLMDACDEREKEEIEKNGDISPYPRVTIYWREDGIFFQFVIDEYRLVFKLDRDKTWKI
ncbi:MAG: hypothetical protein GTO02_15855, partial [Candidatus Dadabacteria bacterium]|nr:hypothetical protein [Candidatus Dadabacteria bacterium]